MDYTNIIYTFEREIWNWGERERDDLYIFIKGASPLMTYLVCKEVCGQTIINTIR